MSTMNEARRFELGSTTRVAVLRRKNGYAVVAVIEEGPLTHEQATQRVEELNRVPGMLSRQEAANRLGLTVKGVDFLVGEGRLTKERHGRRALIAESSVNAELAKRNG